MFSEEQASFISDKTGLSDLGPLVGCVKQCGFDGAAYVAANADLQEAGLDPSSAFFHLLAHGVDEQRQVPGDTLPDGLPELAALAIPDQAYARRLFRTLFFGQLENSRTAARLWQGIDGVLIEAIRRMGGVPYFIIGDSHSNHYRRHSSIGDVWLAPLPMVCHGGSAVRLTGDDAGTPHGSRILRWARTAASLPSEFDVPIILNFGGIDADFFWMWRRLRKRAYRFSIGEFDAWARESVAQYGVFLDTLGSIVDRKMLRISSVFPTAVGDAEWAEQFVHAYQGTPERDRELATELQKLEIPDLAGRTKLRALYNSHLRRICDDKGLEFIDAFSPFLGSDGLPDSRYLALPGDFHLNQEASEELLVELIWRHVCTDAACPLPSRAAIPG